jgi:hypothetical protein
MRGNRGEFNTLNAKTVNCNNITSTGTVTANDLSISSTFYKYITLRGGDFLGSTAPAVFEVVAASTVNSTAGFYEWNFDAGALESLCFSFNMPTDYAEGTDITAYLTMMTTSSTNDANQQVAWSLGYEWVNLDSTSTSGLTGGTELTVFPDVATTTFNAQTTNFASITGTGKEVNSLFRGYIYRNATASTDTWTKDAILNSLSFRYYIDALGSTSTISDK